ncbi:MAG: 3'(2'),5'-bisphosphate nucleotidase [Candidatus Omnitrophica bacterium]|nr:3'(2'),5'-bisphosphate nucleotidase [Candidatus Omnitrophota bacterium]
MSMLSLNSEAAFAVNAVREGALIARKIREEFGASSVAKIDHSPVTIADFAVQAFIAYSLDRDFPGDALVGEESSEILRSKEGQNLLSKICDTVKPHLRHADPERICRWIDRGLAEPSERFWTLDPIDGTKGFVRGGQYAVALALIENGKVEIGVLGCPNLCEAASEKIKGEGSLIVAVRGEGAWTAPILGSAAPINAFKPLHVSSRSEANEARVVQSYEDAHKDTKASDELLRRLGIQKGNVLMDSQAKHAVVASGACDLLFYLTNPANPYRFIKIWDQAAGSLLVEEAGGKITDLDGKDLDFGAGKTLARNRGVLATNGLLHSNALSALKK